MGSAASTSGGRVAPITTGHESGTLTGPNKARERSNESTRPKEVARKRSIGRPPSGSRPKKDIDSILSNGGDSVTLQRQVAQLRQELVNEQMTAAQLQKKCERLTEQALYRDTDSNEVKIAALKGKLAMLDPGAEGDGFSHTVTAQQQCIARLESELSVMRQEQDNLKRKYERRVKRARSQSAKQKAEVSLEVFELKDQVRALQADKAKLETVVSKLKIKQKAVAPASETEQVESGSTQLILQLSTQVAELDEELEEARATIQSLRAELDQQVS